MTPRVGVYGKTVPEQDLIRIIADKVRPDRAEQVLDVYRAMRYLTLLGHVSETYLREMAKVRNLPGAKEAFAPWPDFPFGAKTFTAWYGSRYPFWFDHHRYQLETGLD
jgi:hypothetical protein